jgi:gas vesicle protein
MYFGSVRFFRHLILAVLVLLIAVPTTLTVVFFRRYQATNDKLTQVESIVGAYGQEGGDALADSLAQLFSDSFDNHIPVFQQQVDESVGELRTDLSDVDSRLDALEQALREETKASVNEAKEQLKNELSAQFSSLRKDLTRLIDKQHEALEVQLNQKVDEMSANIILLYNETLTDQVALIIEQIDDIKISLGSK